MAMTSEPSGLTVVGGPWRDGAAFDPESKVGRGLPLGAGAWGQRSRADLGTTPIGVVGGIHRLVGGVGAATGLPQRAQVWLLLAAIGLFTERGYDSTTVTEIAERAGPSRATFFRHFPDDREVLVAGQQTQRPCSLTGPPPRPAGATALE